MVLTFVQVLLKNCKNKTKPTGIFGFVFRVCIALKSVLGLAL